MYLLRYLTCFPTALSPITDAPAPMRNTAYELVQREQTRSAIGHTKATPLMRVEFEMLLVPNRTVPEMAVPNLAPVNLAEDQKNLTQILRVNFPSRYSCDIRLVSVFSIINSRTLFVNFCFHKQ